MVLIFSCHPIKWPLLQNFWFISLKTSKCLRVSGFLFAYIQLIFSILKQAKLFSFQLGFHILDDFIDIIIKLHLKFLVVAATLVRGPFFQDFRQSIEHFFFPSLLFRSKIGSIFNKKLNIGHVFLSSPVSNSQFLFVDWEP